MARRMKSRLPSTQTEASSPLVTLTLSEIGAIAALKVLLATTERLPRTHWISSTGAIEKALFHLAPSAAHYEFSPRFDGFTAAGGMLLRLIKTARAIPENSLPASCPLYQAATARKQF